MLACLGQLYNVGSFYGISPCHGFMGGDDDEVWDCETSSSKILVCAKKLLLQLTIQTRSECCNHKTLGEVCFEGTDNGFLRVL